MSSLIQPQIFYLFGGMALFLLGMSQAGDALQRLWANRIREFLSHVGERPWLAILVGIALTILLQSSGAVTSMLVGLGSAQVITLQRVMGLIVGTAIGSTLTVQIISFNLTQYGLPIFVVFFTAYFVAKKRGPKTVAAILMGFGLVFWGLEMMSYGSQVLKTSEVFLSMFGYLKNHPFMATGVTAIFTALIHSSSATIGLAMSLATSGIITYEEAIYWVYGANLGTASTALMAAWGGNYVGRQVAWAHLGFRLGAFFICLPFTYWLGEFVRPWEPDVARAIANFHTVFNILGAVIFYPFIEFGTKFVEKIIVPAAHEREFQTEYITDLESNPTLAYEKARRETLRMGDIVLGQLRDVHRLFEQEDLDMIEALKTKDNQVDLLHREIKMFLIRTCGSGPNVPPHVFQLISFVADLEAVGDVVDKHLIPLAEKKNVLKLDFSDEGWAELCAMHKQIVEFSKVALSSFHLHTAELATEVIKRKRDLRDFEDKLKESHLDRLNKGRVESINTSSIHLDILADYRRIVSLFTNHAYDLVPGERRRPNEPIS
ncbi:MAG: Na/Pi cotransporter family protein [Bdellovibrionales bacterium]|nr:Na/Pi cotransporter family protein [Bdellovibrionales bacterium]